MIEPPDDAIELRGEQQTMLMSLYLHARDAQSEHPVLGDAFAAPILARIDHDPAVLRRLRGNQPLIVGRAKVIDHRVRQFLARNEAAVVLHLGCGLDSRVLRVDRPSTVTWIEVDQAPVIALRRRFYPDRDGVLTVAGSVTDPTWWAVVPTGRPLLVVAEGLLMYLAPDDVRTTCGLIAGHQASGTTVIADTVAPWVRRVGGWQPTMRRASTGFASTTQDLRDAMGRHRRFAAREPESLVTEAARVADGPLAGFVRVIDRTGVGHRAMALSTYEAAPG